MYLKYKITKFNKSNMQNNTNNLVKESESHIKVCYNLFKCNINIIIY